MNSYIKRTLLLAGILLVSCVSLRAQNNAPYTLQQLIDSAVAKNNLVSIKEWQLQEKISKLKEDETKRYPSVILGANYQYNFSLGDLNIPAGAIGSVPTLNGDRLLPAENQQMQLGQHANYGADIALYQPLLQQARIKTGLDIDRADIARSEKEKVKMVRELKLAVRKLYYGILITRKQREEAVVRLELAQVKLTDAESALTAGKTISSNLAGLRALVAEEEQNILKLDIVLQDYNHELSDITNIQHDTNISLQPLDTTTAHIETSPVEETFQNAKAANTDLRIARIDQEKALLGIKAAKRSNLPDIGLVAGYYYQKGNPILPTSSPYIGINLRWNLQDLFTNHQVLRQREAQLKQAEHKVLYQQQQLRADIDKTHRKVNQTKALMEVARKAMRYRHEELKVQRDKQGAGLNIKSALLEVEAAAAKSEADFYAAQLSYLLTIAELEHLTGL
ncbi:TolC family protein [Ohtaekwangia kribbensis]|uniref:TolC family protein n=1 Tax=Ohtaekwangia kribbensis TaxID=688913 RepID=A0ABW3JY66_9BACT